MVFYKEFLTSQKRVAKNLLLKKLKTFFPQLLMVFPHQTKPELIEQPTTNYNFRLLQKSWLPSPSPLSPAATKSRASLAHKSVTPASLEIRLAHPGVVVLPAHSSHARQGRPSVRSALTPARTRSASPATLSRTVLVLTAR